MSTEDIRCEEQGEGGPTSWLSSVKAAKAHQGNKMKFYCAKLYVHFCTTRGGFRNGSRILNRLCLRALIIRLA